MTEMPAAGDVPASSDVPTPVAAPAAPANAARDRDASLPTPMSGDTTIDVGNSQSLRVLASGRVLLGDVVLQPVDGDVVHGYHVIVTRDEATLTLGFGDAKGVHALRVMKIDLEHARLTWHVVIGANLGFDQSQVDWRVVEARNRLLLVEDERVVAMDSRTGAQAWAFSLLTPDFRREYLTTISPTLTKFAIDDARVRGRELVLAARLDDDREPTMIELDVDSGRRVYIQSRRDAPVQTRLGEFGRIDLQTVRTPVRDQQPPSPPPIPLRVDGYDGVAIGTTLLVWDVRTRRGVIVNPMHDALGEVLARARELRVQDAAGEARAIAWMGVLDTRTIADSVAAKPTKPAIATKDAAAHFDFGLVATDAIDFVDAAALARALGISAITSYEALPKGVTVRLERKPDVYTSIRVLWGPFAFADSNRPPGFGIHVTPL
ncbi:MAG TPA: hypothetical protein VG755_38050 [Nannocystaceae bacterium]|nr:hypothetical protein [Nannocystaceae bacterium]